MVIETCGVSKRYGHVRAVDGVSLRVGAGQIYALLGLNGAGKTTTIRMLRGMVRPSGGRASLFGAPVRVTDPVLWSRVGNLVEGPAAYPELSVRENLDGRLVEELDETDLPHRIRRWLVLATTDSTQARTVLTRAGYTTEPGLCGAPGDLHACRDSQNTMIIRNPSAVDHCDAHASRMPRVTSSSRGS